MKVSIGYATILGTFLAGLGILVPLIGDLADATNPLGISPNVWATITAVIGGLVVIGRMLQAMTSSVPSEDSTLSDPRADINNVDADQGDSGQ